jgi:hypothetical protein
MKGTAFELTLISVMLCLAISITPCVRFTFAQDFEAIKIQADGSIEGTDKIQRQGDVYTLTGDIAGSIEVQKSSITIDGAGHTLQGRKEVNERGVYLVGPDRSHPVCGNVAVKNLRIYNFLEGIFVLGASNNSIIGNYLDKSNIHLIGSSNYAGDLIKQNSFRGAGIFVDYNRGGLDVITENNFVNCGIYVGLSDAPIVDRNYWSDYTAKYPDAKELDGSGIWDTPYVDDRYAEEISCIDYHPLTRPVVIPDFPDSTAPTPSPSPSPSPQTTATPTPEPTSTPEIPEVPPWIVLPTLMIVALQAMLLYFKKRKNDVG